MTGEKINEFMHRRNRAKHLNTLTFIMYIVLAAEKLASGMTLRLYAGRTYFDFSFGLADVLQLLVYASMAVLIACKVKHKYLLIPDFVLLCIKIYSAVSGLVVLSYVPYYDILKELTLLEKTVESLLFSAFLIFLFMGKLSHSERLHACCPLACLAVLVLCVPVTVVFEVLKFFVEEQRDYPLRLEIFTFLRGVINETLLDLPYAMLILLVFYCHNDEKHP